jgi:hypothetical protein
MSGVLFSVVLFTSLGKHKGKETEKEERRQLSLLLLSIAIVVAVPDSIIALSHIIN